MTETVTGGCPICGGDVKGDDTHLFYCDECNILFARHSLKGGNTQKGEHG